MKEMKIKIVLLLAVILLNNLHAGQIKDFKAKNLNFQYKSYSELAGEKLTLIDFWATWCKPCLKAIPKLNELHAKFINKGVGLIGINVDSPRNSAKVKPFASVYNIKYPVLRDPNSKISRDFNISAYPTLLIVDSNRNVVYTHIGFKIGDQKIIEEEILKLLNEK